MGACGWKCVKGEGEALIVDGFEAGSRAALDDHVPDVASLVERCRVQRGTLTRLPSDDEFAHFDPTAFLQEVQGGCQIMIRSG